MRIDSTEETPSMLLLDNLADCYVSTQAVGITVTAEKEFPRESVEWIWGEFEKW
jgi:hypothetical protein